MPTTSTLTLGDLCVRARQLASPRPRLIALTSTGSLAAVGSTATWVVAAGFPPPPVGARLTYMTSTVAVDVLVTAVSGQNLTVLSLAQKGTAVSPGAVAVDLNPAAGALDTYQAAVDSAVLFAPRVPYVHLDTLTPESDDRAFRLTATSLIDVLAVMVMPSGSEDTDFLLPVDGYRVMPSTISGGVEADGYRIILRAATTVGESYQVWYSQLPSLSPDVAMGSLASTLDSLTVNNTLSEAITWDAAGALLLQAERVRLMTDAAGESRTPQEVRESSIAALARQYQARAEQMVVREQARFIGRFGVRSSA